MTDDDLEHNKTMLERGEKILDTKKLRPENQKGEEEGATNEQHQDLSLLRKIKEQSREAVPGPSQDSQDSREQEPRFQPPPQHPAQNYPPRPLFFPVHKYFGY